MLMLNYFAFKDLHECLILKGFAGDFLVLLLSVKHADVRERSVDVFFVSDVGN